MIDRCSLLRLLGVLAYFVAGTVAREAIVGGEIAKIGEFQYQVVLSNVVHSELCGGGLIQHQHVLTAARCVVQPNGDFINKHRRLFVIAGTINAHVPSYYVEVLRIYVPRYFNPRDENSINNIAVLKLAEPLNKLSVRPPPLSPRSWAHVKATITGFGKQNKDRYPDGRLRHADATVFEQSRCREKYPHISVKHLCAQIHEHGHHDHRGTCEGDEGSPLVSGTTVIGILNRRPFDCNEQHHPAFYANVSQYLDFINDAIHHRENPNIIASDLRGNNKWDV